MAAACGEVFIVMSHSRRAFVERLDFVTTFGHGQGGNHRERLGLKTKGPTRVITDLCILEPDSETKELTVSSVHPGVVFRQIQEATAWPIRFAENVAETPPPTPQELEVLRSLELRTAQAHGVRRRSPAD